VLSRPIRSASDTSRFDAWATQVVPVMANDHLPLTTAGGGDTKAGGTGSGGGAGGGGGGA
jgi:uncharacterized membrane protein